MEPEEMNNFLIVCVSINLFMNLMNLKEILYIKVQYIQVNSLFENIHISIFETFYLASIS